MIDLHEDDGDSIKRAFYYVAYPPERKIFWCEAVDVSLYTLGYIPAYNKSHLSKITL